MADGTIQKNKQSATMTLFSIDQEVLNKYNAFTGNLCKITIHSGKTYGARFHSKQICNWLINTCNITPNKSLTLNPTVPITWDLLRGYFDGDGCIRLRGYHAEAKFTTGSIIWAERIN